MSTKGQNERSLIVGVDIGRYHSQLCLFEHDSGAFTEIRVPTDAEAIAGVLGQHRGRIAHVVMEATSDSFNLCRILSHLGYPAILVDARHASPFLRAYRQAKTDRNDAFGLAQLVAHRAEHRVWVRSATASEITAKLATRDALIHAEVGLRNALGSHLAALGIKVKCRSRGKYLRLFEEGLAGIDGYGFLRSLHRTLQHLDGTISSLDREIKAQAGRDKVCRLLMTVPGIGPYSALRFVAVIDDPARFARSRDVGAYIGLVPRVRQSGETTRHGSLTRRGSTELRRTLFMGAQVLLNQTKRSSRLKAWGMQIAQRRGKKRAAVALARKLAVLMHAVWRSGQAFRD